VPQVRFATWVLGLLFFAGRFFHFSGAGMPAGLKRYYGQGHLHFLTFSCYRRLPLLKSVRAREIFLRELARVRDELGFHLIVYVVMPAHVHLLIRFIDQRAAARNAFGGAAETETARRSTIARPKATHIHKADDVFLWRMQRAAASFLASTILRFQRIQQRQEDGEAALYARESGEARFGETSEGLAVEQLGMLLREGTGIDSDRRRGVRSKETAREDPGSQTEPGAPFAFLWLSWGG